jgi:hypothetical protein
MLTFLSFALALTVGPILFIARILFRGKRAIITVPLCILAAWGTALFVFAQSADNHEPSTARAPSSAAARPAAESHDSAPRGVVVQAKKNQWVIRIDDPRGEKYIALRICGASPEAQASKIAPQGEVLLQNISQSGDTHNLQIQDAERPGITYNATTAAECPAGQAAEHIQDSAAAAPSH